MCVGVKTREEFRTENKKKKITQQSETEAGNTHYGCVYRVAYPQLQRFAVLYF